jgi:hypothetical protein
MPQLSGLADEFWLAAYDNTSDDPRIPPHSLGVGLGTALIAELIDASLIRLQEQELFRLTNRLPQDPALCAVFAAMLEEERSWPSPELPAQRVGRTGDGSVAGQEAQARHRQRGHELEVWIAYLADEKRAEEPVVQRVVRSGRALLVERRRLFRGTSARYVPRNSVTAVTPAFGINELLRRGRPHDLTTRQLLLAGLFETTRLDQHALASLDQREHEALNRELSVLKSSNETAASLLRASDIAVSSAALTRR